jgi:hypothetical protein
VMAIVIVGVLVLVVAAAVFLVRAIARFWA